MTKGSPPQVNGEAVRRMFAETASRYDLLNHVLSLNLDRLWRKRAVAAALSGRSSGERILDVCCGTGDLTFALQRKSNGSVVLGSDFCPEMLEKGLAKTRNEAVRFFAGDTKALPFPDSSFDVVTVAFGIRNVVTPLDGLREILRVLAPKGRLVVLEFAMPRSRVFGTLYGIYFRSVLPKLGRLISQARVDAYQYLPDSVESFPGPVEFDALLEEAGYVQRSHKALTMGTVQLHVAHHP